MKKKSLKFFILITLMVFFVSFFYSGKVFASCNPVAPQISQPPNITSISNPVGTFANPSTIPVVISGNTGYVCEGDPGGGLGWDTYSASVEYLVKNSAGTTVLQDFWNSNSSCHTPICVPRPINVNVSVNVASLAAGTYTLQAIATGPSGDGDPVTNPPYNTDTASSSFAITRTVSSVITGSGTTQLAIFDTSGMTGTLTGSDCLIQTAGTSSCNSLITFAVTNPEVVAGTAVTSSTNDSGASSPNFPIWVWPGGRSTPKDLGTQNVIIPYINGGIHAGRTFYLYNNAKSLVPTSPNGSGLVVSASCDASLNLVWSSNLNQCVNANSGVWQITWNACSNGSQTGAYHCSTGVGNCDNSHTEGQSAGSQSCGGGVCSIPPKHTNPCSIGTPSEIHSGISSWTWTCTNAGAPTSCAESKKKPIFIEN